MTDVKLATLADLTYLDHLQTQNRWQLGWLPRQAQLDYVERGHALLLSLNSMLAGILLWRPTWHPLHKHYERGTQIVQICVEDGVRRLLYGTELLRALAAQSPQAHGSYIRCWCASDLDANAFWAALGFRNDLQRDLLRGDRVVRSHRHWTLSRGGFRSLRESC